MADEFVYHDHIPANARIIVDYTKDEKVKFSYPVKFTYWQAVIKRGYYNIFNFWITLHAYVFFKFFIFIILGIITMLFYVSFYPIIYITEPTSVKLGFFTLALLFMSFMFYTFGIPLLITLFLGLNKERASKYFPKLGYWTSVLNGDIKTNEFTTKDIINNKVILPVFNNVFLNYKAFDDFNKYLYKVEILELPYNYKTRRVLLPWKSQKQVNEFYFRAVFYFSQTPEKGSLNIEFD